jgi:hypothetical protein
MAHEYWAQSKFDIISQKVRRSWHFITTSED